MKHTLRVGLLLLSACYSGSGIEEGNLEEWLQLRRFEFDTAVAEGRVDQFHSLRRLIARAVESRVPELLELLDSSNPSTRLLAIFGLGFVQRVDARDRLLDLLGDEAPGIRASAAAGLGMQGLESTPVVRLVGLLDDRAEIVRKAALFGLWMLLKPGNDRGTLPAVLRKLDDDSPTVRAEAYMVLCRLANPQTVKTLAEKGLKDPSQPSRMNAAAGLGAIGPDAYDAVPHLIEALRDEDHDVVAASWHALRKVTGMELDPLYQRWRDWYEEELKLYWYICPTHPETKLGRPGKCAQCGVPLKRDLRTGAADASGSVAPGDYVCPDHPNIRATAPLICLKCGKTMVPKKDDQEQPPKKDKP